MKDFTPLAYGLIGAIIGAVILLLMAFTLGELNKFIF